MYRNEIVEAALEICEGESYLTIIDTLTAAASILEQDLLRAEGEADERGDYLYHKKKDEELDQ